MSKLVSESLIEGVKLHTIKTEKFKTGLLNLYFQRPLNSTEVTYNSLLPMVLLRGCEKYNTSKSISREREHLYGTLLYGSVKKKGERHIIEFSMTTADKSYVEEKNIHKKCLELLNNIVDKPLLEEGVFKSFYVVQEKANLHNKIKGRLNDKMSYAVDRLVEEMCENEGFKLHELGREEDLAAINPTNLYRHYEMLKGNSPIDIIAVGSFDHNELKGSVMEALSLRMNSTPSLEDSGIVAAPKEVRRVVEEMEINQGKLSLGYRVGIHYSDHLYPAMILYTNILGGGAHSKLFLKVREEASLCYYIFARLEKFKSLLLISCGIEAGKYELTVEIISQQLEEMKRGNISDDEMRNAKRAVENSIRTMSDSAGALAEFYYSQIISKHSYDIEDLLEKIQKVKADEIVAVAERVKLDTIHFLNNRK